MICFGLLNFAKYGFHPGWTAGQSFGSRVTIRIQSNYLFMPFRIFCCKSFYLLDMSLFEKKGPLPPLLILASSKRSFASYMVTSEPQKWMCYIYIWIYFQMGRLPCSLWSHRNDPPSAFGPMFRMPFHEAKGGDWGETHPVNQPRWIFNKPIEQWTKKPGCLMVINSTAQFLIRGL